MAAWKGSMKHKGGRYATRGWKGAKAVKRMTAKHVRRMVKLKLLKKVEEILVDDKGRSGYSR